ncbi:MAG: phosphohydrolase [Massilibacteroides sp.]|nr:phosphohydrolase [Massilibacteroides sp.]MDD4660925.1 phosphohydrolase [Massilibacteroides sp.]
MNPLMIISKYYSPSSKAYHILVSHSQDVVRKALELAALHPKMKIDTRFVEEAAMLHDLGIFLCDAPEIGCHGEAPYICHGYLGSELLQKEGLPKHALVCERHTGTGLSLEMIEKEGLPLPHRDMQPVSIEEQLICFSDKFFSKTKLGIEKPVEKIKKGLSKYGTETEARFDAWCKLFLGE